MKTRITLLTGSLIFAIAGVFAQTKPTAPAPIVTAPPVATAPPPATVGQTITLSGTAYKVSAKKVIATGVEYYSVKATTPKAVTKYYLRSDNGYNPTIFTQAQYASFVQTGKLSSFGTLQKLNVDGRIVNYVAKGSTIALFGSSGGVLGMNEFIGTAATVLARANDSGGLGQSPMQCKEGCRTERTACDKKWPPSPGELDSDICFAWYVGCLNRCETEPDMVVPQSGRHLIRVSKTILFQ